MSTEKKDTTDVEEHKQRQAWGKHFSEQWMLDMGVVPPNYLEEIRYKICIAFPINRADVSCNPHSMKMEWAVRFKFFTMKFKKRRVIKKLHSILQNLFPHYEVTVEVLEKE